MTLDDLYTKVAEAGKATPSVFLRISSMEDFSSINPRYCEAVCRIPCKKSYNEIMLKKRESDVVILLNEKSRDGKWRPGHAEDKVYNDMIYHLMGREIPGATYQVLHATKCRPEKDTKKITLTQTKACFNYLHNELAAIKPKVIIATSTECLKALGMTKATMKKNLSEIVYWNDIPVIVTLHPRVTTMIRQNASGAFWGDDFFELIRRDFHKAHLILQGTVQKKTPEEAIAELKTNKQLVLCTTLDSVRDLCDRLANLPSNVVISWDTETTGLDPWAPDARFLCHQFGVRGSDGKVYAYIIPLWHKDNDFYNPNEAWVHVKRVLESQVTKVGHHGKFDLKYTRVTTGVNVVNYVFDTMYASHSLCSGLQGTYGLKKAVWDWLPDSGLGGYEDLMFVGWDEEEDESDSD